MFVNCVWIVDEEANITMAINQKPAGDSLNGSGKMLITKTANC